MNKRFVCYIIGICIGLLLFGILSSCRTVNKTRKSHTAKSDSTISVQNATVSESQDKSVTVEEKKEKSDKDFEVVIEYNDDTAKIYPEWGKGELDTVDNDSAAFVKMFRWIESRKKSPSKITIKGSINKITDIKTTTNSDLQKKESGNQQTKTKVKKEEENKESDTKKKGIPVGVSIWIVAVIAVLIVAFVLYRKFIK